MDYTVSHILQGLGTATPTSAREPHITIGNHELAIIRLYIKPTQAYGAAVCLEAEVVKSDNAAVLVGSKVEQLFRVNMQSARGFEQKAEFNAMLGFCNAVTGNAAADTAAAQNAMRSFIEQGTARGFMVKCRGWRKAGKEWVNLDWSHFPGQSEQSIAQIRAYLDSKYPLAAAPAQAPAPQAPPPPPAYVPPAQAPAPLQNAPAAPGGFNLASVFGPR